MAKHNRNYKPEDIAYPEQAIVTSNLVEEMEKSYIEYAMSVIVGRALPDVRDGLKPVHRRILYTMYESGLTSDKPFKKSATCVGDVLGKYHPHGDSSVYDAMVRLAQDFSMRYMLVDGHGNFGSVDGDPAAAYRYTEARMSKLSNEMLRDIDKDTVNWDPNFDESRKEPRVLPSRFPNLLVNGSNGIAVGMATNIPPHNLTEVINACVCVLDDPEASMVDLMEHISGPDFPTGGIIMGRSGIRAAYATGRGKVVVRARTEFETFAGDRTRIIVDQLPYQVNKTLLLKSMADQVKDKRIEGISDLRDESDRNGMRIVIELKKDANPQVVLNNLFKQTALQSSFGIIMLALVDDQKQPKILSLRQIIDEYLTFQMEVLTRRTQYDLRKAQERAHLLEGLLIAQDNIDEVIRIIRSAYDDAKEKLMERFGLSDVQAQAILDMRLKALQGLDREKLKNEYDDLHAVLYVFWFILFFLRMRSMKVLRSMNRMNVPRIMPIRPFWLKGSMKEGAYRLKRVTVRQNGMMRTRAVMSLSLLSWTLASRFTLSFHLIMHASSDGNMPTRVFRSRSAVSKEMRANILNSMSVSSFSFISHFFEQCSHPVTEITLDGYFPILGASTHSAFNFQSASQFAQVVCSADKSGDQGHLLAAPAFSVD